MVKSNITTSTTKATSLKHTSIIPDDNEEWQDQLLPEDNSSDTTESSTITLVTTANISDRERTTYSNEVAAASEGGGKSGSSAIIAISIVVVITIVLIIAAILGIYLYKRRGAKSETSSEKTPKRKVETQKVKQSVKSAKTQAEKSKSKKVTWSGPLVDTPKKGGGTGGFGYGSDGRNAPPLSLPAEEDSDIQITAIPKLGKGAALPPLKIVKTSTVSRHRGSKTPPPAKSPQSKIPPPTKSPQSCVKRKTLPPLSLPAEEDSDIRQSAIPKLPLTAKEKMAQSVKVGKTTMKPKTAETIVKK